MENKDSKLTFESLFGVIEKSMLSEAFNRNVTLQTSSHDDENIQKFLKIHSQLTGKTLEESKQKHLDLMAKTRKNLEKSNVSRNAVENSANSSAFNMLDDLDMSKVNDVLEEYNLEKRDLLDRDYFFDLTRYIIGENAQFFPLRNPYERKSVKPFFFITPDHLPLIVDPNLRVSAENHCKTAFCTPKAEMVYNREFCEKLSLFAIIQGVKPKSKKYISNGGKIPDYYCYLEFLIMHELLHFSQGDHFYNKPMTEYIKKKHPKFASRAGNILNICGDYINNHTLLQSGYEQLPIGLFSDEINYENYNSYEEMIDATIKDMEDMSEEEKDDMQKEQQESMDDHMESEDDTPSPGGQDSEPSNAPSDDKPKGEEKTSEDEGEGSGGSGDESGEEDSEEGNGNSQGSKIDSEEGEGSTTDSEEGEAGDSSGTESGESVSSKINDAMKKARENMEQRDDGNDDAETALNKKEDDSKYKEELEKLKQSASGSNALNMSATYTPIDWKRLLKKLIPSGEGDIEDTYSKMSRASAAMMVTAKQTGMGSIKPGEIEQEPNKRGLVFVIDSSGSVANVVGGFNKQIAQLVKRYKKDLDYMYIMKFSGVFDVYKIDLSSSVITGQEMVRDTKSTIFDKKGNINLNASLKSNKIKFETILGTAEAGATKMTSMLYDVIAGFHKQGANIILFTDDDLAYGDENIRNTKKLYNLGKKRQNSMAMFITDRKSLDGMNSKFGKVKFATSLT